MRKFSLLSIFYFMLVSCMSSNFTFTGNLYDPLPLDYPVTVVLTENNTPDYHEIGLLQIIQEDMNNISKVVELAKEQARLNGGDLIILINSNSDHSISANQYGVYSSDKNTYLFVIAKIIK